MITESGNLSGTGSAGLLRAALLGNAIFSAICGVVMVWMPHRVSAALNWQGPNLWLLVGLGLLVFAGALLWQGKQGRPSVAWGTLFSLGDYGWVIGTVLLGMFVPTVMSGDGWMIAWGVSAVVVLFGSLQLLGIARMMRKDLDAIEE